MMIRVVMCAVSSPDGVGGQGGQVIVLRNHSSSVADGLSTVSFDGGTCDVVSIGSSGSCASDGGRAAEWAVSGEVKVTGARL